VTKIEQLRAGNQNATPRNSRRFFSICPSADLPPFSTLRNTFLPGFAQNIECDVTSRKQTTEEFLPGATSTCHREACTDAVGAETWL
jgi:hypothetical protein